MWENLTICLFLLVSLHNADFTFQHRFLVEFSATQARRTDPMLLQVPQMRVYQGIQRANYKQNWVQIFILSKLLCNRWSKLKCQWLAKASWQNGEHVIPFENKTLDRFELLLVQLLNLRKMLSKTLSHYLTKSQLAAVVVVVDLLVLVFHALKLKFDTALCHSHLSNILGSLSQRKADTWQLLTKNLFLANGNRECRFCIYTRNTMAARSETWRLVPEVVSRSAPCSLRSRRGFTLAPGLRPVGSRFALADLKRYSKPIPSETTLGTQGTPFLYNLVSFQQKASWRVEAEQS